MSGAIIINADDLGRDGNINRAILTSFKEGHCSSATIMPNMPGFEEACTLVNENRLLKNVGLHLTLRDGYPITEAMKRVPAFCDKHGVLSKVTVRSPLILSGPEKHVLAAEIRAQIARCRAFGLPLTHMDSHCHTHTNFAIVGTVMAVALEQGIAHVRLTRNAGPDMGFVMQRLKAVFNARLKAKNLAGTDYFGSIDDLLYVMRPHGTLPPDRSMEVMIHPVLGSAGRIVDRRSERPIGELVGGIPGYEKAISYAFGDLQKDPYRRH
jgi:chitin disaccharide deacetylase